MPELVDINIATKEELATLPGVRETIAENISAFRSEHGRFATIEELLDVEGITRRLLDRLRELVIVDTAPVGSPTPESVDIQLSSTSGGGYTGHSVAISGIRRVERDEETQDLPSASSAPTDRTGLATLPIPSRSAIISQVTLRAIAPDGELLKSESQAGATLPPKVTLAVEPRTPGTTQPRPGQLALVGRPRRLVCQLLASLDLLELSNCRSQQKVGYLSGQHRLGYVQCNEVVGEPNLQAVPSLCQFSRRYRSCGAVGSRVRGVGVRRRGVDRP